MARQEDGKGLLALWQEAIGEGEDPLRRPVSGGEGAFAEVPGGGPAAGGAGGGDAGGIRPAGGAPEADAVDPPAGGLERWFEELRRRTRVVRIFPNRASCLRLIGAHCLETNEEWLQRRYLRMDPQEMEEQLTGWERSTLTSWRCTITQHPGLDFRLPERPETTSKTSTHHTTHPGLRLPTNLTSCGETPPGFWVDRGRCRGVC